MKKRSKFTFFIVFILIFICLFLKVSEVYYKNKIEKALKSRGIGFEKLKISIVKKRVVLKNFYSKDKRIKGKTIILQFKIEDFFKKRKTYNAFLKNLYFKNYRFDSIEFTIRYSLSEKKLEIYNFKITENENNSISISATIEKIPLERILKGINIEELTELIDKNETILRYLEIEKKGEPEILKRVKFLFNTGNKSGENKIIIRNIKVSYLMKLYLMFGSVRKESF